MTEYFYKLMATLLLLVLVLTGVGWILAARETSHARVALAAEQDAAARLRGAIATQNQALQQMSQARQEAEARGLAARQLALENGRRFDGALRRIQDARAVSCSDAMPAVNLLLESLL
ncbi:hypothetical protein [Janthinobacterium agaricidamnosum]|uniref:Uncharacterized protein n=1 Tax=Janthinobacterium agaricidamnosum NBRC 102515 = DSM 9628 TaxID=1349767 RepID=W0V2J4_9BURK|nr:hypothetical protein [Janthinobacterium agaricidamnosum]CDG82101.1 hypothetical protein GJA_1450 [Janthinobacterium agaricidamnosum NBRC 102515 = DSM 9628]